MGKTNKKKEPPVRPVQKIELRDKNNKGKFILVILLLIVGLGSIGYGMFAALSTEKGWREIEANNTEELNCSADFVFMYNIGAKGDSPTVENKAITNLYSDATVEAYKIFTSDKEYEDIYNIYYMNQHPNEEVEVHEALYKAFELLQEYQNRYIYLAPIYVQYDDIFYCKEDFETVDYDPYTNEEVTSYYQEIATYANDPEAVNVELLGNNRVKLVVSEEYLTYAEENGIERFIDLHWMKNAFVTDYLADVMISNGYRYGTISSFDGFSRNLDDSGESYSLNIFDKHEQKLYSAAVMEYEGAKSIVYLRNYMIKSSDEKLYYELQNGETRTSYLDVKDGKCKSSVNSLISYSENMTCAEILMNIAPLYITETFDENLVNGLKEADIYSMYCIDNVIYYNDSEINIKDIYETEEITYTTFYNED